MAFTVIHSFRCAMDKILVHVDGGDAKSHFPGIILKAL